MTDLQARTGTGRFVTASGEPLTTPIAFTAVYRGEGRLLAASGRFVAPVAVEATPDSEGVVTVDLYPSEGYQPEVIYRVDWTAPTQSEAVDRDWRMWIRVPDEDDWSIWDARIPFSGDTYALPDSVPISGPQGLPGTSVAPHDGAAADTDLTGLTIAGTDYELVDTAGRANTATAQADADTAQSTADTAQSTADAARTAAATAQSTAATAQSTAATAQSTADTAQSTADAARTAAAAAQSTADTKRTAAQVAAAVDAGIAGKVQQFARDGTTKIPAGKVYPPAKAIIRGSASVTVTPDDAAETLTLTSTGISDVAPTDLAGVSAVTDADRGKLVAVQSDDRTQFALVGPSRGTTWTFGSGAPTDTADHIDGDAYLATDTDDVYAFADGAWAKVGNIGGAQADPVPLTFTVLAAFSSDATKTLADPLPPTVALVHQSAASRDDVSLLDVTPTSGSRSYDMGRTGVTVTITYHATAPTVQVAGLQTSESLVVYSVAGQGTGSGTSVAPHSGTASDTDLTGLTIDGTDYEVVDTAGRANTANAAAVAADGRAIANNAKNTADANRTLIGGKADQTDLDAEVTRAKAAETANRTLIGGKADQTDLTAEVTARTKADREGVLELAGNTDDDIIDSLLLNERAGDVRARDKYYVSGGANLKGKLLRRNATALPDGINQATFRADFSTYWEEILADTGGGTSGGLSAVSTSAPVSGDGTPSGPVTIADKALSGRYLADKAVVTDKLGDKAVGAAQLADAVTDRLLPTLPATGARDGKVPRFDGDLLGWAAGDGGGGGGGGTTVAGLRLSLLGTDTAVGGAFGNIPKEGGGTIARSEVSDVFLVDLMYNRHPNSDLRMAGLVVKSDLDGTDEYKFQVQGAGGDFVTFRFSAAGDAGILQAKDDSSSTTSLEIRIFNTAPAPAGGGGGSQRSRQDTIDLMTGDTGGDIDLQRVGSGAASHLRGAIRDKAVGTSELEDNSVTSVILDPATRRRLDEIDNLKQVTADLHHVSKTIQGWTNVNSNGTEGGVAAVSSGSLANAQAATYSAPSITGQTTFGVIRIPAAAAPQKYRVGILGITSLVSSLRFLGDDSNWRYYELASRMTADETLTLQIGTHDIQYSQYDGRLGDKPLAQAVPDGGTTGQVLAKKSSTDRDTEWVDASTGGGGAGTATKLGTASLTSNRAGLSGLTVAIAAGEAFSVYTVVAGVVFSGNTAWGGEVAAPALGGGFAHLGSHVGSASSSGYTAPAVSQFVSVSAETLTSVSTSIGNFYRGSLAQGTVDFYIIRHG